ncbi:hypothetical protein ACIRD6_02315 [Streptomyces sp. NPDC102473]|uniref:hypothetical protein n=1 Tax=Streptomyces sp. NPDC102473 TaxID=3366180 RepID=UPI003826BB3B
MVVAQGLTDALHRLAVAVAVAVLSGRRDCCPGRVVVPKFDGFRALFYTPLRVGDPVLLQT